MRSFFQSKRVDLFFLLAGIQLLVVSFFIAFAPLFVQSVPGNVTFQRFRIIIVVLAIVLAGAAFTVLAWLRYNPELREFFEKAFRYFWIHLILILFPVGIAGFLSLDIISADKISQIYALLLCLLVICLEFILFFSGVHELKNRPVPGTDNNQKRLAAVGCVLVYVFLLVPSRLYSSLDGIPLENPLEFILAVLIIPLLVGINWLFFSNRRVLIIIAVILGLKLLVAVIIPESGLNVRLYENPQNLAAGKWDKNYASILHPTVTQIMKSPYENTRQFPFSLLTQSTLDNILGNFPPIGVTLQGRGVLEKGEKILFLAEGLQKGEAHITDNNDGRIYPLLVLDHVDSMDEIVFPDIPAISDFQISGTFVFHNTYRYTLIPVLVRQDGTQLDLFQSNRVWTTKSSVHLSSQALFIAKWLVFCVNLFMITLLGVGLSQGIIKLYQKNRITITGLFIFSSSSMLFLIPKILGKAFKVTTPYKVLSLEVIILTLPIITFILLAGVAVLLEHKFNPAKFEYPEIKYLFSVGFIILITFMVLNIQLLGETTVFSQNDDPFEYQNFARNIFVNNDLLLLSSPPRAYKVLFPYIVGALHFIFGQSSAAQMYINAWCCVLSGIVLIKLLIKAGCRPILAYWAAWIFTVIIFGSFSFLYFQFGLIEPLATLFLLLVFWFAQNRQPGWLVVAAVVTTLLHLEYVGPAIAALLLYYNPFVGTVDTVWKNVFDWFGQHWRRSVLYAFVVILPSLSVIAFYFFMTPNYMLNARDTRQSSIYSVIEGWQRIVSGGNLEELYSSFTLFPLLMILTTSVLISGTLIGLFAGVFRPRFLQNLDLRWSIILLSFFSVYIFVRPTGYSPRFSTPLLPIAIIILITIIEHAICRIKSKVAISNQETC
ncbi:MAG: hypothetical protein NTW32_07540 [Chloroflexi bacterium]|nr:hypothetical protein [Chloroflexota bacterium]